jgi:hypothetical protein
MLHIYLSIRGNRRNVQVYVTVVSTRSCLDIGPVAPRAGLT